MRTRIAIPAAVIVALAACVTPAPVPKLEDAGGDAARLDRLAAGRALYVGHCGGCHALHSVARFSDREWREQVGEMVRTRKVRLTAEERARLIDYLTAFNRGADATPGAASAPAPGR
jgi:hypothetical protein